MSIKLKSLEEVLNEAKLSKDKFEKFLSSGKSFQIKDNTLWLNSDKEWMLNMKKSDFNTLYKMYVNSKDVKINEAVSWDDITTETASFFDLIKPVVEKSKYKIVKRGSNSISVKSHNGAIANITFDPQNKF